MNETIVSKKLLSDGKIKATKYIGLAIFGAANLTQKSRQTFLMELLVPSL